MFDYAAAPGWFDYVGFAVTMLGLFFAWLQSREAKDAADSARNAVVRTELKLSMNQLLLVLASIQQNISDIDHSSVSENKEVAKFALSRFGLLATEAAELLDRHAEDGVRALSQRLRTTSQLALDAKASLAKTTSPKVARFTADVQIELAQVNLEVTAEITRLRYSTGDLNV